MELLHVNDTRIWRVAMEECKEDVMVNYAWRPCNIIGTIEKRSKTVYE